MDEAQSSTEAILQEHVRLGNMETMVEDGEVKYRLTAQGQARADELTQHLPHLRGPVDGQHRRPGRGLVQ